MAFKRLKKRVRDFLGRGRDPGTTPLKDAGSSEPSISVPPASTLNARDVSARNVNAHDVNARDVGRTEDTVVHQQMAPAVTHETVQKDVHEIRHEQIHRDIHEHHVVHRVQPIVVRETLPARHFVMVDGVKREVSEDTARTMGYLMQD